MEQENNTPATAEENQGFYDVKAFGKQLKKARLYKGYKQQSQVVKEMNISRQVFSLWELGKRLPSMGQLVEIANLFEISMGYFCIQDADPEDFDLPEKFTEDMRTG